MGFNWVTFIAQIINLFVLVWLLKRFLYNPIIQTIEKRQAYIAEKVKKAEETAEAAQKEQQLLLKKQALFDADKQRRLEKVNQELEILKKDREEKIAKELHAKHQKMQSDLNREAASLQLEIRNLIARQFLELSQKVMSDLSGLSPVEQAVLLFRKKIEKMSLSEKKEIQNNIKKQDVILIYVSDALSKKSESDLIDFIRKIFKISDSVNIRVALDSTLILGAEMNAGNITVAWNLKSYLEAFEGNLNTALSGLIIKE